MSECNYNVKNVVWPVGNLHQKRDHINLFIKSIETEVFNFITKCFHCRFPTVYTSTVAKYITRLKIPRTSRAKYFTYTRCQTARVVRVFFQINEKSSQFSLRQATKAREVVAREYVYNIPHTRAIFCLRKRVQIFNCAGKIGRKRMLMRKASAFTSLALPAHRIHPFFYSFCSHANASNSFCVPGTY